jgi:hypothetical protein
VRFASAAVRPRYKDKPVEGGKAWKLSFKNPGAADKTKDTLYLFYSLPGIFIAPNHTGQ